MKPTILATRAIAGTTFRRVFKPLAIVIGVVFALLYIGLFLLASNVSVWWLIFLVILIPITLFVVVILLVVWKLSGLISPRKLDKSEKAEINKFTDSLIEVWEVKSTPMPVVAFMVGKDLLSKRKSAYVEKFVNSSASLKTDFSKIVSLFDKG